MSRSESKAPAPGAGAALGDWLSYLESIHPVAMDLGLDRVLLVLRKLMPARPNGRVITVGGTNGKGSTVAALEALLLAAGETVGCFTSPHLQAYNERVRLNGQNVSDESLIRAFEQVEAARGSVSLTYFEFGTLAALLVMAEAGVDNLVLEVGLGGRLDAVNVLDADLAIITSVDLDHTAWLGEDRNTIGYEKAGILRPGQVAIYADDDPPASVLQQASAQKVRLLRPGQGYTLLQDQPTPVLATDSGHRIRLPGNSLPLNSLAAAAMAGLELDLGLDDQAMADALAGVSLAGRFEQVASLPDVFLDVGHNPHAAQWLARRLDSLRGYRRLLAVYAGLEDKNSAGVVQALAPVIDHWYIAGLDVPRGLSGDALAERVRPELAEATVFVGNRVADAIENALHTAGEHDLVLIFGSFFTVVEGRGYFR
ncbi:bifunctional tetrahydrofolate synthase/dihydrofolate synthase [Marinobacter zhanjiangensis]|uniref:Dihydrofolate synthase/folylpolyglutamate synthase n=1 Tax=Marinobacter zhanjiangensis TaxID=578215 RepID=A0ABQ3BA17_9GAMM|nr:bifunctional tetrahydrofolate synthase/dihydrofolate synthase [Marinobacter zhanjiangensis]GGY82328.1 bifunctional folylpolyglutamate synthase/dihydrofolate synthase [Marinobacter zhanjiangensis]